MDIKLSTSTSELELQSIENNIVLQLSRTLGDRRLPVPVNPTLPLTKLDYDGFKFSKKEKDLALLILISWYSEYFEPFREYLRYEIEVYLYKHCLFPYLAASLVSQKAALILIIVFVFRTPQELFGNALRPENIKRVLSLTSLRFLKTVEPRYPIRRRGYKDKGSMRPAEAWLPKFDLSFIELQQAIEERRENYRDEVLTLVRICGGRELRSEILKSLKEEFNYDRRKVESQSIDEGGTVCRLETQTGKE